MGWCHTEADNVLSWLAVTVPGEKPDDGAFDIITEEEVNDIYDSDSRTTTGSQEEEGDGGQTGDL